MLRVRFEYLKFLLRDFLLPEGVVYSRLDTIFNYIIYFGPSGKYVYLSPKHRLSIGLRSRPLGSRFYQLVYR